MSIRPRHDPLELQPHPLAELFPLPAVADLKSLIDDIRGHGQQVPITLHEGKILDGRSRYRACRMLGVEPAVIQYDGADPAAFVLSMNLHRRHLTTAQKRKVIGEVLRLDPSKSNNSIAGRIGVDDKTVGSVRRELEGNSEIPKVEKVTCSDGTTYTVHRDSFSGATNYYAPGGNGPDPGDADTPVIVEAKAPGCWLSDAYKQVDTLIAYVGGVIVPIQQEVRGKRRDFPAMHWNDVIDYLGESVAMLRAAQGAMLEGLGGEGRVTA